MTDNPRAEAIERIARSLWNRTDCFRALGTWDEMPADTKATFQREQFDWLIDALGNLLPRRVFSEAELDALPMHSIVRIGNYAYQALGNGWFNSPADPTYSEAMLDMAEDEPVFVLWTPPAEGVQQ